MPMLRPLNCHFARHLIFTGEDHDEAVLCSRFVISGVPIAACAALATQAHGALTASSCKSLGL
jgi:hypothetical protein